MVEPRRDWGEHVYQADLDVTLYESTVIAYELADVLLQIKYGTPEINCQGENLMDILRPHLEKVLDTVGKDVADFIGDDNE